MKRSGPPERRTPLGRGRPPQRRKPPERAEGRPPIRRGRPLQRRGRLRQVSDRRASERDERRRVVKLTLERAGFRCEAAHLVPDVRCGTIGNRPALEVDEKVGRGVYPGAHLDPNVTQALCPVHHDWKHANPAEAKRVGLTVSEWDR